MKYRCLKYIDDSIQIFEVCNTFGITTTTQLSAFLECAINEGRALYQIFGDDSTDPNYLKKYTAIRKMMQGDPRRVNDGLNLLTWGETIYRRERAVLLTKKGLKLLTAIQEQLHTT